MCTQDSTLSHLVDFGYKGTDPTHHSLCPSHSYLMGPFLSLHSTIGTVTVRPVPLSAGVGRGSGGGGSEQGKEDIN